MSEADRLADALVWTPPILLAALARVAAGLALRAARRPDACRAGAAVLLAAAAAALSVDLGWPGLSLHPAAAAVALAGSALLVAGPGRRIAGSARAAGALALAGSALLVAGWADAPDPIEARARESLRRRLDLDREAGDPEELYLVLEALADERWFELSGFDRRPELAAPLLARLGRRDALASRLASPDRRLVREAALALASLGDERAALALDAEWGSGPAAVDPEALRLVAALGKVGDPRALDWATARHRAASAPPPPSLDDGDRRLCARLHRDEAELLERTVASFRPDLAVEFSRRTGAARPLGSGEALRLALADPDPALAAPIAAAVRRADRPETALDHPDPGVRREAQLGCFRRGRRPGLRDLAAQLPDAEAARALAFAGDPAGAQVLRQTFARGPDRAGAAVALSALGDPAGLARVQDLLRAPTLDPALADLVLAGPPAAPAIERLVVRADPSLACEAARSLALMGRGAGIYPLVAERPLRAAGEDRAWAALLVELGAVPADELLARDLADSRGPAFALAAWTAILARRHPLRELFARRIEADDRPLVALGILALDRSVRSEWIPPHRVAPGGNLGN